ncbi:PD40 domain-containing protein [Flavihumibacter rivuli]|uniref:TolB family protein n=1 Tax=Flavihumibacter rivuli TaxID=2838156 RepID=UPI001BDF0F31|nr:PD40 domain-containing protein [Flavihumibacter rivuli]ULQ58305.1 PD40 domain-containing protein [Flavihumibacter rivuli]
MKWLLLYSTSFLFSLSFAQGPVGIFSGHADIGSPAIKGDAQYHPLDQSYHLQAGGYNIWFGRDEFHYAFNTIKGDFILTANFKLLGKGVDTHRKTGWMVRASKDDDAAHMTATVHGDGMVALQWRRMKGAHMRDPQDELFTKKQGTEIIQLERQGKVFIMRVAHPGEPLQEIGRTDAVDMPDEVLAGIFLSSHNPDVKEEAMAWNVRIEQTVPDDYNGYAHGVLPSRLEVMNVFDGKRRIVHEDKGRFEAPNWMKDGKRLLFNQGGAIYTLPVEGGQPEKLNTGSANRNNNDHVISFDGKWLAISSHREGMPGGGSTIYVLPITGGEPLLVTDSTPSYLHGWSPDGKEVVYTAQRRSFGPTYNIFKKPVKGGKETQLTFLNSGLADGPEYSPDGKWIYYNATESGSMQVWRMRPDGSGKEQLTFDEYNNWFPHISPDNKWIVFLSFPNTVSPNDHPFYKRVMLRLMPVAGGAPRAIAYLYGGQGTINTPSWSPDSKHIAFVSNTGPAVKQAN